MALVRKGSRLLTVDGVRYRWRVRRRPTDAQGNGWTPLTFGVELAERPGSVLLVSLPRAHPGNWLRLPGMPVRPALVAAAIRLALAKGWLPGETGPAFRLRLSEDDIAASASPGLASGHAAGRPPDPDAGRRRED